MSAMDTQPTFTIGSGGKEATVEAKMAMSLDDIITKNKRGGKGGRGGRGGRGGSRTGPKTANVNRPTPGQRRNAVVQASAQRSSNIRQNTMSRMRGITSTTENNNNNNNNNANRRALRVRSPASRGGLATRVRGGLTAWRQQQQNRRLNQQKKLNNLGRASNNNNNNNNNANIRVNVSNTSNPRGFQARAKQALARRNQQQQQQQTRRGGVSRALRMRGLGNNNANKQTTTVSAAQRARVVTQGRQSKAFNQKRGLQQSSQPSLNERFGSTGAPRGNRGGRGGRGGRGAARGGRGGRGGRGARGGGSRGGNIFNGRRVSMS